MKEHIQFQKLLLNIDKSNRNANVSINVTNVLSITRGHICVSSEGINGVLSGQHSSLQHYKQRMMEELMYVCQATNVTSPSTNIASITIDLDVKIMPNEIGVIG